MQNLREKEMDTTMLGLGAMKKNVGQKSQILKENCHMMNEVCDVKELRMKMSKEFIPTNIPEENVL